MARRRRRVLPARRTRTRGRRPARRRRPGPGGYRPSAGPRRRLRGGRSHRAGGGAVSPDVSQPSAVEGVVGAGPAHTGRRSTGRRSGRRVAEGRSASAPAGGQQRPPRGARGTRGVEGAAASRGGLPARPARRNPRGPLAGLHPPSAGKEVRTSRQQRPRRAHMTGGDASTERRLARLRQRDSIGMYAADGPASRPRRHRSRLGHDRGDATGSPASR